MDMALQELDVTRKENTVDSQWISLLEKTKTKDQHVEGWLNGDESRRNFLSTYCRATKTKFVMRDSQKAVFARKQHIFWKKNETENKDTPMMQLAYYRYKCGFGPTHTRLQNQNPKTLVIWDSETIRGRPRKVVCNCPAELIIKEFNSYEQYALKRSPKRTQCREKQEKIEILTRLKEDIEKGLAEGTKNYFLSVPVLNTHTCVHDDNVQKAMQCQLEGKKHRKRKRKCLLKPVFLMNIDTKATQTIPCGNHALCEVCGGFLPATRVGESTNGTCVCENSATGRVGDDLDVQDIQDINDGMPKNDDDMGDDSVNGDDHLSSTSDTESNWFHVKRSIKTLADIAKMYENERISPHIVQELASSLQAAVHQYETSMHKMASDVLMNYDHLYSRYESPERSVVNSSLDSEDDSSVSPQTSPQSAMEEVI